MTTAVALLLTTLATSLAQHHDDDPGDPMDDWAGPVQPASGERASTPRVEAPADPNDSHFYVGLRSAVAVPPGGLGVSPSLGVEMGIQRPKGVGFGLHLLGMGNPSDAPALGIPKAEWGLGALADLRVFFQTKDPLTLFLSASAGFMVGPAVSDQRNIVLPLFDPGFGGQLRLGDGNYLACEFGLAAFTIPYLALSFGWDLGAGSTPPVRG